MFSFKSLTSSLKKIARYPLSHKKFSIPIIIALAALLFFLWPKPVPDIATQTITPDQFTQSISVNGKVDASDYADLNFLAGGKLVYLGVKKGDTIAAGQTIGVLDQRTALKNLQDSLIDYSKQRGTFDDTLKENQNRTPQQALNDQMKRILINNQYDLEKAVISVELDDLAKQQSVLTSPISGIVTRADAITAGVNVGITTTFSVVNPDTLVFKVDVDQADIAKIKIGQTINVNLDAYPDNTISLTVSSIDFTTHATSTGGNAYTVQAQLVLNGNFDYRVGMEGSAQIVTAQEYNVLSVPISALTDSNDVYVKTKTGYEKRKVGLGLENDTNVVITEGLTSGDNVVLDPSLVPQKKQGRFFGLF